ncbi:MAG: signal recognition particle-docking protein FtsY [Myxococcales bacterium]|nr:signal recognition particle-docking protein FtsY [Myxococcales bacterium]
MDPVQAGEIQETEPPVTDGAGPDPALVGGLALVVLVIGVMVAMTLRRSTPPLELPSTEAPAEDRVDVEPSEPVGEELQAPTAEAGDLPAPSVGLLERFRQALGRSRSAFQQSLERVLGRPDDDEALQALEDALIQADVGVSTAQRLIEAVRVAARQSGADGQELRSVLRQEMLDILQPVHRPFEADGSPFVLMVVGVNGSGKTTTIGKLAHRFREDGRTVLLAAGDTFRAAAAEQLQVWAERTEADFVRLDEGADPGAVIYQALERAQSQSHDVVIIDTAGRLQTRKPLMEQLAKIRRVIQKRVPDGPHETLLVLDGTMGQNGMSQAALFNEATPLTGVAVTKLDGTAKGGMVLAIAAELELPVKLVGLGEQARDLRDFEPEAFVDALLS